MPQNVSKKRPAKKNIQYPPQTGAYKTFVKDKSVWKDYSVARLQISVGNPKHTGDKFFALTEWAASRFDKVILVVSDTLQRHNISVEHGVSLEEAYQISVLSGQRWLKENQAAIDNLLPSQRTVTLWDEWMMRPDYIDTLHEVHGLYDSCAVVRTAINEKADNFYQRHPSGNAKDRNESIGVSIAYILEEVAAFAVMFKESRAIDVYPGEWFKEVFEAIAQNSEKTDKMSGFLDAACLRVDFTRNRFS